MILYTNHGDSTEAAPLLICAIPVTILMFLHLSRTYHHRHQQERCEEWHPKRGMFHWYIGLHWAVSGLTLKRGTYSRIRQRATEAHAETWATINFLIKGWQAADTMPINKGRTAWWWLCASSRRAAATGTKLFQFIRFNQLTRSSVGRKTCYTFYTLCT